MGSVNRGSFIHRQPAGVSKNKLLEAIREQRKAKEKFGWVVLGIMREGVQPSAVIVKMDIVPKCYEPNEYDVLARVDDYDRYLEMNRLTRQDQMIIQIYNTSRKWEEMRRKEFASKRLTQ